MYAGEVKVEGGVDFTESDSAARCHAPAVSRVQLNDVFPVQTGWKKTYHDLRCFGGK